MGWFRLHDAVAADGQVGTSSVLYDANEDHIFSVSRQRQSCSTEARTSGRKGQRYAFVRFDGPEVPRGWAQLLGMGSAGYGQDLAQRRLLSALRTPEK